MLYWSYYMENILVPNSNFIKIYGFEIEKEKGKRKKSIETKKTEKEH